MFRCIARRFSSSAIQLTCGLLACITSWNPSALAEPPTTTEINSNTHIEFNRSGGGETPLSAQINAEARYVAACGYMYRSVAEARKINAEAVALEIQNSVDYVKAYYERRHLYEEEWRRKHPDVWTLENQRQTRLKERVAKQYQAVCRDGDGNVTTMLNWLLQELANSVVSYQYVMGGKTVLQPESDMKLSDRDIQRLRLTDGGHKNSRLVFAAGDGNVLLPKWPLALRRPECDAARNEFDQARDAAVKEIRTAGKISYESQTRLMKAVNGLYVALDAAFSREQLLDTKEYSVYAAGKRYVQTLVAAAHRAITINDASVFNGQLRFQGNSLFALVQHMHQNGLEFAPPEPGAEGLYRTVFENLRTMYIDIGREQSAAESKQVPKDQDKP
jgi:hypothetical protein